MLTSLFLVTGFCFWIAVCIVVAFAGISLLFHFFAWVLDDEPPPPKWPDVWGGG